MFRPSIIRIQCRFNSTVASQINVSSKESFLKSLEANPTLLKLWHTHHHKPEPDLINANNTLPIVLRTKKVVFEDIQKENPKSEGVQLKFKQYTGYFKSIIHFYRIGIQNVWQNRTRVAEIKSKYSIENVEQDGSITKRKLKNSGDLINLLNALETMQIIEQETLKKFDKTTILNLNRLEFQTILRTQQDFYKIPLFAMILLVFAETTPILCYIFPELAPSTCVFPGLLIKKYSSSTKAFQQLTKLRLERYGAVYSQGEIPFQSVYKLPHDELKLLVQSLNLKSKYLPVFLYPISTLQARLKFHYDLIKVDNHYLINGEDGNNIWGLNKNELIRSCLDRGLLDLEKDDLIHIGAHTLKLRLLFHLCFSNEDKSIGNVGVFGINQLGLDNVFFKNIGNDEAHKLYGWWGHEHKGEK